MKQLLEKYVAYLKDNPKGYWFKRKLYGWGWTPARWQGWLTLVIFIGAVFWNMLRLDINSNPSDGVSINFAVQTFALIVMFILIAWRTGETPRWTWGIPQKKDSKEKE